MANQKIHYLDLYNMTCAITVYRLPSKQTVINFTRNILILNGVTRLHQPETLLLRLIEDLIDYKHSIQESLDGILIYRGVHGRQFGELIRCFNTAADYIIVEPEALDSIKIISHHMPTCAFNKFISYKNPIFKSHDNYVSVYELTELYGLQGGE